jgi:hypothetical protein
MLTPGKGVGVGTGVGVSVGIGVWVSVGVRVGVGGRGVLVAFLIDNRPGREQDVYRRLTTSKPMMSQERKCLCMLGTIPEEQRGVK